MVAAVPTSLFAVVCTIGWSLALMKRRLLDCEVIVLLSCGNEK